MVLPYGMFFCDSVAPLKVSFSLTGKFAPLIGHSQVDWRGFGGMAPPVVGTTRCMSGGTDDDLG
jgi:hypothetical protein